MDVTPLIFKLFTSEKGTLLIFLLVPFRSVPTTIQHACSIVTKYGVGSIQRGQVAVSLDVISIKMV